MNYMIYAVIAMLFMATTAFAHQPRLNQSIETQVPDPEISKAYYGKLTGDPHIYRIFSDRPLDLYVGILVPDIVGQKKDVSASIIENGNIDHPLAVLDGGSYPWKPFFEEFARDSYLSGQEFRAHVPGGRYDILVWSSNNDSKYSLAIGEIEAFDFKESWNAVHLIPQIKSGFFGKSPVGFILSPFGYGYVIFMFALSAVFGFAYRALLKKFASGTPYGRTRNIGNPDKLFRVALGIFLFAWAVSGSWSPWLLFFSGFCFFDCTDDSICCK